MFHQPTQPIAASYVSQPIVYFTPEVMAEMNFIVENAKIEVGWLGIVQQIDNNVFLVDGIYIPKQKCHSASCILKDEGIDEYGMLLCDQGQENRLNDMRFWGHTHCSMGISPSGQDDRQYKKLCGDVPDYFIRLIVNNKREWNLAVAYPVAGFMFENVPWNYHLPDMMTDERRQQLLADMKDKVEREKTQIYRGYNYYGSHPRSSGHVIQDLGERQGALVEEDTIPWDDDDYIDLHGIGGK